MFLRFNLLRMGVIFAGFAVFQNAIAPVLGLTPAPDPEHLASFAIWLAAMLGLWFGGSWIANEIDEWFEPARETEEAAAAEDRPQDDAPPFTGEFWPLCRHARPATPSGPAFHILENNPPKVCRQKKRAIHTQKIVKATPRRP